MIEEVAAKVDVGFALFVFGEFLEDGGGGNLLFDGGDLFFERGLLLMEGARDGVEVLGEVGFGGAGEIEIGREGCGLGGAG